MKGIYLFVNLFVKFKKILHILVEPDHVIVHLFIRCTTTQPLCPQKKRKNDAIALKVILSCHANLRILLDISWPVRTENRFRWCNPIKRYSHFLECLGRGLESTPNEDSVVLLGDLNSVMGDDSVIGRSGLDFCASHRNVTSTMFKHGVMDVHKWTWHQDTLGQWFPNWGTT